MDAPERGALMLVRFIAVSLIGISVVEIALYWVLSSAHHTPMQTFSCVLKSMPAVAGIVILIKARAVADWLSDLLD
jgi:hypothetical protein